MRRRWDEHCENGRARAHTLQYIKVFLSIAAAGRLLLRLQESYYDYDYYLNSRLMRARRKCGRGADTMC